MNAKTAKSLRKVTRNLEKAAIAQGVDVKAVAYTRDKRGTVTVNSNTFRGAYLALKKSVRQGTAPPAANV